MNDIDTNNPLESSNKNLNEEDSVGNIEHIKDNKFMGNNISNSNFQKLETILDDESLKSSTENNSNIAVLNDSDSNNELSDIEYDDLEFNNSGKNDENHNEKEEKEESPDKVFSNKYYVTNMKTIEELESESKLVTEKEIYNLGINQALINKEEEEFKHKFEKLKNIINDSDYLKDVNSFIEDIIKNKKYLVLQSTLNNHIDYIKILDSVIFKNEKNIQKLKEEKVDLDTQVDDLFDETESLNNKIDKNEERISNLRNKCTSKNQKFKILLYLSIFLNINSFLIGHIGFINYSKNIYQYSVDIYNVSYFVLSNILNYSLLVFSNSITLYISFGSLILYKIYIFYKNYTKKINID